MRPEIILLTNIGILLIVLIVSLFSSVNHVPSIVKSSELYQYWAGEEYSPLEYPLSMDDCLVAVDNSIYNKINRWKER